MVHQRQRRTLEMGELLSMLISCSEAHPLTQYCEQGRELKASELQARTVVILEKENQPAMMTLWVRAVAPSFVLFIGEHIQMGLILLRDGELLYDDTKTRVHVYQYLGGDEPTSGAAQA